MDNEFKSLDFSGFRKLMFYFSFSVSVIALIFTFFSFVFELFTTGRFTSDNVIFQINSIDGSIFAFLFGERPYNFFVSIMAFLVQSSSYFASALWVNSFIKWQKYKKGEVIDLSAMFGSFIGIFTFELASILSWPYQGEITSYFLGILELFISIIVCWPVVKVGVKEIFSELADS